MQFRACAAAAFGAVVLAWSATAHAAWSVQPFTTPGSTYTQLWDVNNAGQIVGNDDFGSFVYSGGSLSYLPAVAGASVLATGISGAGLVVGALYYSDGRPDEGFIYQGGSYTRLVVPGATFTNVRHVSANGRYLTGTYDSFNGFAYDRTTATLAVLPATDSVSYIMQGATDAGLAVGSASWSTSSPHPPNGVLYDFATRGISYDAAAGSSAPRFRDINNAGLITGYANLGNNIQVAIVGTAGGSFETISVAGLNTYANGLNDAGTLVGLTAGLSGGNTQGFIATSVPEPGSWALLMLGLPALRLLRRQR